MKRGVFAAALVLAACDADDTGSLDFFARSAAVAAPGDRDAAGSRDADCVSTGACECLADPDCGGTRRCDESLRTCVDCLEHADCAEGLRCDPGTRTCQPGCRTDDDCTTSSVVRRCHGTSGACVQCLSDADCVGQFHSMCLVTQSRCEECHFDVQCPQGQSCNALEGRCH